MSIFPKQHQVFKALSTDPNNLKVVILGQDPYPTENMATGLAFGIPQDSIVPKSLSVMMRELLHDYPDTKLEDFDVTLESWANQGVMLLNSSLTCFEKMPGSHKEIWKPFMIELVTLINDLKMSLPYFQSIVFVLLGKQAQEFKFCINEKWHYIIERPHPAAEAYGGEKFTGFYKEVNKILKSIEQQEIKWT